MNEIDGKMVLVVHLLALLTGTATGALLAVGVGLLTGKWVW